MLCPGTYVHKPYALGCLGVSLTSLTHKVPPSAWYAMARYR